MDCFASYGDKKDIIKCRDLTIVRLRAITGGVTMNDAPTDKEALAALGHLYSRGCDGSEIGRNSGCCARAFGVVARFVKLRSDLASARAQVELTEAERIAHAEWLECKGFNSGYSHALSDLGSRAASGVYSLDEAMKFLRECQWKAFRAMKQTHEELLALRAREKINADT